MFFSSHLCVGLLFLGLYRLPPPPSPPELLLSLSTSPKLSHTTYRTHPTQLLSSHKSQISSHTTPLIPQLTQLVSSHKSHNSSHTTHLSQLILHNSTYSRAAFVCHLVELLSCSLTEVHPSSFTQLISQLTQLTLSSHPTPPHPTPPPPRVTDHERTVRVSSLQQER